MRIALILGLGLSFVSAGRAQTDDPKFNDRAMSEWLAILKNDSLPRKRKAAAVALGQIAADFKDTRKFVLPALATAIRTDPAPAVRGQAAVTLGQQPPEFAGAFVTDLAECLRTEKDAAVKKETAIALGRIGRLAKAGVLPLTTLLKDADPGIRAAAAEALGRIGSDAKSATAALLPLVKDADPAVRRQAIFALGRVDSDDAEPTLAALVEALNKETDPGLRLESVVSLGLIGVKTADVAAAIALTLTDTDGETRKQACLALAKLGFVAKRSEAKIRAVAVGDADKEIRALAIRALTSAYASDAIELIPLLTERLAKDPDFEVRIAIAEELGSFGNAGRSAIPALRAATKDPQRKVRESAAAAIKQIERPPPKPDAP
jgi:HEAT repeat protein